MSEKKQRVLSDLDQVLIRSKSFLSMAKWGWELITICSAAGRECIRPSFFLLLLHLHLFQPPHQQATGKGDAKMIKWKIKLQRIPVLPWYAHFGLGETKIISVLTVYTDCRVRTRRIF